MIIITKLHLGSGSKHLEGYINMDISPNKSVDIQHNCISLPMFKDNSIDEIVSFDFIEHLKRKDFDNGKREWHRVLKPGGKLIMECPNIEILCKAFVNGTYDERWKKWRRISGIIWQIYGNQMGPTLGGGCVQCHKWGYTPKRLMDLLSFGFKNFKSLPAKSSKQHLRLECEKK